MNISELCVAYPRKLLRTFNSLSSKHFIERSTITPKSIVLEKLSPAGAYRVLSRVKSSRTCRDQSDASTSVFPLHRNIMFHTEHHLVASSDFLPSHSNNLKQTRRLRKHCERKKSDNKRTRGEEKLRSSEKF